ncbi:hypothetical protein [Paraburkholderia sp. 32]|uniref:hypothetical protein n=1 Tax=unclassified Paraburkholderia TaxID=2615204 RepID=UPI003D1A11CD
MSETDSLRCAQRGTDRRSHRTSPVTDRGIHAPARIVTPVRDCALDGNFNSCRKHADRQLAEQHLAAACADDHHTDHYRTPAIQNASGFGVLSCAVVPLGAARQIAVLIKLRTIVGVYAFVFPLTGTGNAESGQPIVPSGLPAYWPN